MAEELSISRDGVFELDGRTYQVPEHFSTGQVLSYRTLLEPTLDNPRGRRLTPDQRVAARAYLLRRAVACVVPGFRTSGPESLPPGQLQILHWWIAQHRPELSLEYRSPQAKPR